MTLHRIIGPPVAADRTFERTLRRVILAGMTLFLMAGAIASYRAFVQVRRLELRVEEPILRAGSRLRADVVCSGRVPVTITIELVQGVQVETLAAKIVPNSRDPFFDPRTVEGTLSVKLTPEIVARFLPGPALVRATARGRPQWLREPPPLIREVKVSIQQEPALRWEDRGASPKNVASACGLLKLRLQKEFGLR